MKRLVVVGGILIVLLAAALLVATFFVGSIIKKGVETAGPSITKVDVKLEDADVAFFSGRGELKGLFVGNPEGFQTPSAIQVQSMDIEIVPRSVLSDKVVVKSLRVMAPEITFEGNLQGNNLSKLLDNIRGAAGQKDTPTKEDEAASRKIQVDDLVVSGGKINLSVNLLGAGKAGTVPLPEIHLTALGQGPEGITAAELSERLLRIILENATKAVAGQLGSMGKDISSAAQGISTGAVQEVEKKVTEGIGNLLKKK